MHAFDCICQELSIPCHCRSSSTPGYTKYTEQCTFWLRTVWNKIQQLIHKLFYKNMLTQNTDTHMPVHMQMCVWFLDKLHYELKHVQNARLLYPSLGAWSERETETETDRQTKTETKTDRQTDREKCQRVQAYIDWHVSCNWRMIPPSKTPAGAQSRTCWNQGKWLSR